MSETKTALQVMEESKQKLEKKVERLENRISGGTARSRLEVKIHQLDEQIAKLMTKKGEIQDQIADLVEDSIDTEAVKAEIAGLKATIGEYEKAIETLSQ